MERNHYFFSLSKKNQIPITQIKSIKPINNTIIVQKVIEGPSGLTGLTGPSGLTGPTGPSGKDGDRFCTKTINKTYLNPSNDFIVMNVDPGLAYISGNSVIVAQVADNINSELNTFEGTIQYYNKNSGQIIVKDITNIHGNFFKEEYY